MRRRLTTFVFLLCLVAVMLSLAGCRGAFVGNKYTYTYHDRACIWAEEMSSGSQVWFADTAEADAAGYEPCESCAPKASE